MIEKQLEISGDNWSKYLNALQKGLTFIVADSLISVEKTEEEKQEAQVKVELLAKQYYETVKSNIDVLFHNTALEMAKYVNFYEVYPKGGQHDELKGIFFTGMAISDLLVSLGYLDLNRYHLNAVLGLMDYRLDEPYRAKREVLTERIRSMIDNNVVAEHLGKYGWYLIYKCLYNSAAERVAAEATPSKG